VEIPVAANHLISDTGAVSDHSPHKVGKECNCLRRFLTKYNKVTDQPAASAIFQQHSDLVADLSHIFPMNCGDGGGLFPTSSVDQNNAVAMSFIPKKKGRILVVDDVPMNRKMLKRFLISRFDVCEEAENGQQAVDMVKEAMMAGINYDVITVDYQMPVMDGVTATSTIRRLGYKGRIIGVTGNAMQEDVNLFLSNGADKVLTKPLSFALLNEYLSTLP